jgi:GDPmannose 4,6-dehydratase
MKKKVALITGVTGQDGAYLSRFLLKKNYIVHGIKRRSSSLNTSRIDDIYSDPNEKNTNFFLHYGDMVDSIVLTKIISQIKPDEIYNLAAQSHVAVSFQQPEYTANADALGALRILEIIKNLNLTKKTKFYQAGTSEMFGKVQTIPQNEKTPFYPRSPYGVAKLFSHWMTINYRESYNMFASNGILFNHESPIRGETFVTKKVVDGLCTIKFGLQKKLFVGNLNAKRDWGHAKDYARAMWLILQHKKPDDFVISTGKQYSIRQLINLTAKKINLNIKWINKNQGLQEYAVDQNGKKIIQVSKNYFRPAEVETLLGDYKKAKKILGWKPSISFDELITEMIQKKISQIKTNENKKN